MRTKPPAPLETSSRNLATDKSHILLTIVLRRTCPALGPRASMDSAAWREPCAVDPRSNCASLWTSSSCAASTGLMGESAMKTGRHTSR